MLLITVNCDTFIAAKLVDQCFDIKVKIINFNLF